MYSLCLPIVLLSCALAAPAVGAAANVFKISPGHSPPPRGAVPAVAVKHLRHDPPPPPPPPAAGTAGGPSYHHSRIWHAADHACREERLRLCALSELCPEGPATEPYGGLRRHAASTWVPVRDGYNMWAAIGGGADYLCRIGAAAGAVHHHILCCANLTFSADPPEKIVVAAAADGDLFTTAVLPHVSESSSAADLARDVVRKLGLSLEHYGDGTRSLESLENTIRAGQQHARSQFLTPALQRDIAASGLDTEQLLESGAEFWLTQVAELQECIRTRPSTFLGCPVILHLMFKAKLRITVQEFNWLDQHTDADWLRRALRESNVGSPPAERVIHRTHSFTSTNMIHHVYSLARFEHSTGAHIADMQTIVEFGGGYGSFARIAFQQGFRGQYVIHDLRPFGVLQRFFLLSVGISIREIKNWESGEPGVYLTSSLAELESLHLRTRGLAAQRASMFVAMFSLSEVDYATRDRVMAAGPAVFGHMLFWYQWSWRGVIPNSKWFGALMIEERSDLSWHTWEDYGAPSEGDAGYRVVGDTGAVRGRNRFAAGSIVGGGCPG